MRVASGDELRGKVISKGAEGEFATQRDVSSAKRDIRAVAIRVAIPNPRHTLVPGMTAQVLRSAEEMTRAARSPAIRSRTS